MNMHRTDSGHDCALPVFRTRLSGRAPRIIEVIRHSRPYGPRHTGLQLRLRVCTRTAVPVLTCLAMFSIYYDRYM